MFLNCKNADHPCEPIRPYSVQQDGSNELPWVLLKPSAYRFLRFE